MQKYFDRLREFWKCKHVNHLQEISSVSSPFCFLPSLPSLLLMHTDNLETKTYFNNIILSKYFLRRVLHNLYQFCIFPR